MEFLGWPYNDSLQPNMGFIGLVVQQATKTNSTKHKGYDMKVTKSLEERLFVMHLRRDLDITLRIGQSPNMEHSVLVARSETLLTIDCIEEIVAKPKSASGGEA